jgi:hypothetical protein
MQYVKTRPVLNVEESDRLSFHAVHVRHGFHARRITGVRPGEKMDAGT